MNGWLIFLALLAGYFGVLYVFRRAGGKLGGAEVNGPFIMWRTQFGKRAIQWVARPRRFWEIVADVGILATWLVGLAIFALLIYQLSLYFTAPDVVAESGQSPEFLIGLPGVNPLIPFGYGIVALIFALVIHEGSHGVMAYVSRMRVKSLGLLLFIVPVGAFVEPDEEDLEKASAREKNRVFAAGPSSNLVLALAAGLLLSLVFLPAVSVANDGAGVGVGAVVEGSAAEAAGLAVGDVLVELRNVRLYPPDHPARSEASIALTNSTVYSDTMSLTRAGDPMTVVFLRDGERRMLDLTLSDRAEFTNNESLRGKGFMGVAQVNMGFVGAVRDVLQNPFASGFPESFSTGGPNSLPGSFFIYIAYPFLIFTTNVDVFGQHSGFLEVSGPMAALPAPVFFGIATLLYWIVWIDLMLGTFNALPAGPLDGGQMLKATLRDRLMRRHQVDRAQTEVVRQEFGGAIIRGKDDATQAKLDRIQRTLSRTTWTLGLFILGLILLPIFGPPLLKLVL